MLQERENQRCDTDLYQERKAVPAQDKEFTEGSWHYGKDKGSSWSLWGGTLQCDSSWCCWSPSDSGGPILEHRGSPFGADSVQQGQLGDVVHWAGFPGQSPLPVGEGQVFLVLPPAQLFLQLSLYLQEVTKRKFRFNEHWR